MSHYCHMETIVDRENPRESKECKTLDQLIAYDMATLGVPSDTKMAEEKTTEQTTEKTTKKINRVRRKGDVGVQGNAPGKFRAFLGIGYENGKRKCKTFTGKSPTEVIKLLNAYKAEQLTGTLVADNKITFDIS